MSHDVPMPIAFVGLGWGSFVAETLLAGPDRERFRIAAVCDVDEAKVAAFSVKLGVKGYTSIDALLADETIPTIGLFTGPVGRADLLRKIIRCGKDVMTTKPFELDPRAARDVLEEARVLRRTIHVNSPSAEPPRYLAQIRRWQEEHALGRPVSCRAEMLVSYREAADGRWLDDPALCPAAPIFRLGIYSINDLVRLFGPVQAVNMFASRLFTGRPTADNAQLGLLFASGAIGSVHASFCVDNGQHYANALTLNFENGTIYRNVFPVNYGEAEKSSRLTLVAAKEKKRVVYEEWFSDEVSGSYEWETFHDAITGRRAVEMPIEEIVDAIKVIEAMKRADASGKAEYVSSDR
ncbi:MAG TPA: Gfo/Idh/MocA family oxidoreductase [Opitutaceae bacterium]|nr:Gfo/Idh/MocA family oxidoreductase [Opitutaceae bacterium]